MTRNPPKPRSEPSGTASPRYWLALIDRHHARLLTGLELAHGRNHMEDVERLESAAPDREHGRASPRGAPGHGTVPFSREEEERLTRFARDVGTWLSRMFAAHGIDRLALVAPGHVLGELRRHLPAEIVGRIDQEDAELTHLPANELVDHPLVKGRLFRRTRRP